MHFLSALATGDDPSTVVRQLCEQLTPLSTQHQLGLIYLTDTLAGDAEGIVEGLRLDTGIEAWCGATALGVCGESQEVFDTPAVSVLVCPLPSSDWRVFGPCGPDTADDGPLAQHEHWRKESGSAITLLHADPRHASTFEFISRLGAQSFLLGGLLSSRARYAQIGERIGEGLACGVLFSDRVSIVSQLTQGCSPIGPRHVITRANGQLLSELDHRPALDVLAADLAAVTGFNPNDGNLHAAITVAGDDTGDYLVRHLVGADGQRRALMVAEDLTVGHGLMFCRRDATSARDDLRRMLSTLSNRLPSPPRGGIYVSCLARGPNLFDAPNEETRLIREVLGEFPLTGFFANGELARDRVYAYTGVLTLFL